MRKLPRWKKHCYIRNTRTGGVERRIHGDADFMVKNGGWIFTTREAWQEYVRDTPRPIPERKPQTVLVPAVKSGFRAINGVLIGTLNLDLTGARKEFSAARNVITDWRTQQEAEDEQYKKTVALYAEQEARRDHKCRVRLAEELAQITRAQEAARKIHAEHPPVPTEYLSPEAIAVFIKHGSPARNVRRNAGPKPKLCPVCGLPETREKPFEVAHKIPHTAGVRAGFTPEYLGCRENLVWAHRGKCNDMVEIPPGFWITEAKREAALAAVRVIASDNNTGGETNAETRVVSDKSYVSKGQFDFAITDFDEAYAPASTTMPFFAASHGIEQKERSAANDQNIHWLGQAFGIIGYKGKVWSLRYRGEEYTFIQPDDGAPVGYLDVVIVRQSQDHKRLAVLLLPT